MLNEQKFYTDHSHCEVSGYAILKSSAGYVVFETVEYRRGEARVKASTGGALHPTMLEAMQELRRRTRGSVAKPVTTTKLQQALQLLGISSIESVEQVKQAFRSRVHAMTDGKGGYNCDMDALVNAKEYAIAQVK